MNQGRPDAIDLVGTNRGSHAAAADGDAPLHVTGGHRAGQWQHVVRIIVVPGQAVRTEIHHLMPGGQQPLSSSP